MHPGIWITKAETKNHGAPLKNILPAVNGTQWNVEGWRYFLNGGMVLWRSLCKLKGCIWFDLPNTAPLSFYKMPSSANE
jgi:hypothetical protein